MSGKNCSLGSRIGLCAVLAGTLFLTGCSLFNKKKATTTGAAAVTLSPTTLTFSSGVGVASAPQTVTLTNSGAAALSFTGVTTSSSVFTANQNCAASVAVNGTCTITVMFTPTAIGAVTGTLSVSDNASGSPQTVNLSGTGSNTYASPATLTFSGVAVGTTSAAQTVTLTNASTGDVAVTSIATTSGFAETNTCGASVAANGSCTISVTYSATAGGPTAGSLTIVDTSGTQTVALTASTSNSTSNQAQVTVGFGINGNTANASTNYYNGLFTTVTVCTPGTTNCVNIPNVLVDTGSVGLRVLSTALTGITLTQMTDPATSQPLYECVQYGDLSYSWGPMQRATVEVGGETASAIPASSGGTTNTGIPIQVIAAGQTPPSQVSIVGLTGSYLNPCLYYPASKYATGGNNDDTITTLGANGILGVGNYPQDCGSECETATTDSLYLICQSINSANCQLQGVAAGNQAWNPVSAFPVDNNGVSISLPAINAAGATSVTGTLTFGIGTKSNNSIANTAGVYELDADGNFASATFEGVTYCTSGLSTCPTVEASGGTFIDSGSNAYYLSDGTDLSTGDCIVSTIDIGYYCTSSNLNLSLGLTGANNTTTTVTIPIENATTLFQNTSYAAFNDLAGPSCTPNLAANITCDLAQQYFDLGLPFFFGRPIYVGISGGTQYPNGYWAF